MSPIHCIIVVSNPVRFATRYRLFKEFIKRLDDHGVWYGIVELALRNRPFEVTEAGNPRHLQLRHDHEIWIKESLLNLGVQRLLPDNADKIAFVDADVAFTHVDWAEETAQQLEHYKVVQMFAHAVDLGPDLRPIQQHTGFVYAWQNGVTINQGGGGSNGYDLCPNVAKPVLGTGGRHHPGFCWAWRREALDAVGGVLDFPILGSADWHMACGLVGEIHKSFHSRHAHDYNKLLLAWQDRAETHIRRKIGYVPGTVWHYWHGKKVSRGYETRWKILQRHEFSPATDLIRGTNGVLGLAGNKQGLRDDIMKYFRARSEDSIDE